MRGQWLNPRRKRFWAIAALLLYTIIGFFLVPNIVKSNIIGLIEDDLGRSAQVEKVEFNPYALSLKVSGFELKDTDEVSLLAFDQLFVNFQLSSLLNQAWTFDEISLLGSYFYFERFDTDDTRLSRLLDDASAGQTEDTEEVDEGGLPRLLIHHLILSDGRGDLKDNMPKTAVELQLGPIDITIEELNTLPDRYGQQNVTIKLPGDATLHWEGNLALAPLDSEGQLILENAPLDNVVAYLEGVLPLETIHVLLSGRFHYQIHVEDDGTFDAEINELDLDIDDLALTGLTPATDFLSVTKIALRGGTFRYQQQTVQFNSLHIEEPTISAWLNKDGSLNLADLAPAGQAPDEHSEPDSEAELESEEAGKPWQLGVHLIAIDRGSVGFTDHSIDPAARFDIKDLAVKLTDFTTKEGAQLPLSVSGKLRAGGQFNVDGTVNILPQLALSLSTQTKDIPLSIVQPYVQQTAHILIEAGLLNSDLNITIPSGRELTVVGSIQIPNLDIKDNKSQKPLIAWKALALNRLELDMNTNKLGISALDFEQPYARFTIYEDQSTNVSDLIIEGNNSSAQTKAATETKATSETEPPEDAPTSPMQVVIGGIHINDAALDFADMTLPLPFATHIDKLDGTISSFATDSSEPAKIKLEGQVNEYGLARIEGDMNLLDPLSHTDVALEFRNLDMSRMSPYSGQFAGRKIKEGKLTLDLNYAIEKGIMDGKNDIILADLQLGDKIDSPNATSLPLDLAVALLKDPDGVISARLPVAGDVNDPQFELGGIIWDAFVGMITDVVTAPFRFLGSMIGVDSEDFGQFQFLAGRADLTPPELEQIAQLGKALEQRPELAVEISGTIDPAIDVPALQFITLRNTVIEQLGESFSMDNKDTMLNDDIRETLETLFQARFPEVRLKSLKAEHMVPPADDPNGKPVLDELAYAADLRDRLLAAEVISDQMLADLANARAQAIRTAFQASGKFDDSRMTIINPKEIESKDGEWITLELAVDAH